MLFDARSRRALLAAVVSVLFVAALVPSVIPAAAAPVSPPPEPQSLVRWGDTVEQMRAPDILSSVTAVSAGGDQGMVLNSDGTVIGWGGSFTPSGPNPLDVPVGLDHVTAISAGLDHDTALRSDGTVVAWGVDDYGQADVPPGLTDVSAVSAGVRTPWP